MNCAVGQQEHLRSWMECVAEEIKEEQQQTAQAVRQFTNGGMASENTCSCQFGCAAQALNGRAAPSFRPQQRQPQTAAEASQSPHLKAAAVCDQRPLAVHEGVQASRRGHDIRPWVQQQVVRVLQ